MRDGRLARAVAIAGLAVMVSLSFSASAVAGQASTGKLAFHPCTKCHPVTLDAAGKPTKPLPNGFEKHEIELEVHDVLGQGDKACLACHDDPARDPGKLLAPDGSPIDITGDVSRVCQKCHFEKYREWQVGVHGKHAPKCSAAGCHDPHTPSWIYIEALPPFQGTGLQVRAVSDREPFKPLAGPPLPPPVVTPAWLTVFVAIGSLMAAGIVGVLVVGRLKR